MASNSDKLEHSPFGTGSSSLAIVLRSIVLIFLLFILDEIVDFGTSPYLISIFIILGVYNSTKFFVKKIPTVKFLLFILAVFFASKLALWSFYFFPFPEKLSLSPYSLGLHFSSCLIAFIICSSLTWIYWKSSWGLTFEILILILTPVSLLAGHRHLHFDRPQFLGDLAWYLQQGSLQTIIIIGVFALFVVSIYSGFLSKVWIANTSRTLAFKGRTRYLLASIFVLALCLFAYIVSIAIFKHYNSSAFSRTANGVGQASSENNSPLGFHSALGGSNQPSALVRLDGDYKQNPFLPMLYLRESALSQFDGNEMVVANSKYDPDVQNISPGESYVAEEDASLLERIPLTHSVYLLSDQKNAFAIDYPLSITRLKKPSDKFKSAYKVYSVAPGFKLETLLDKEVGDPRWSNEYKEHYLEKHSDPRYAELAKKISEELPSQVAKAKSIVDYLSKTAIYTLTPNHEVKSGEDPVAPFLFGDHRGYCVHFAHAMVYMFRSLGIPARIGTGYLTDLSQSKDGHILLRMSDRHAWAEVYIKEYGWIPFDPKPEQVESHAESPVDMNLLEELMADLEPDQEILPDDIANEEYGFEKEKPFPLPELSHVILVITFLVFILLILKTYLLYGWLWFPKSRLRNAYMSSCIKLYDLGLNRSLGETKEEFRSRLHTILGKDALNLTSYLNSARYGNRPALNNLEKIKELIKKDSFARLELPLWKRLISPLNPISVFRWARGKRW